MIQKWKSRGSEKVTWGFSICDKVTRQFAHLIVLIIPQFRSTTLFSEEEPQKSRRLGSLYGSGRLSTPSQQIFANRRNGIVAATERPLATMSPSSTVTRRRVSSMQGSSTLGDLHGKDTAGAASRVRAAAFFKTPSLSTHPLWGESASPWGSLLPPCPAWPCGWKHSPFSWGGSSLLVCS